MSQSRIDKYGREILRLARSGATSIPLSNVLAENRARARALPPVSESDLTAISLGYVHDAIKTTDPKRNDGQFCKNCNLVLSKMGEWRPCTVLPGDAVNQNGWCKAWTRKT